MLLEALDLAAEQVVVLLDIGFRRQLVQERSVGAGRQAHAVPAEDHGPILGGAGRRADGKHRDVCGACHAGRRAEDPNQFAPGESHSRAS